MKKFFIKAFMALNTFIIRASQGRLGTLLASQTVLLLHSVGRRTGQHYITPISYFKADGYYFLVGSNWGRPHNAAWYYNLLEQPRTVIEIRGKQIPVVTHEVFGSEYDCLWKQALKRYPPYIHYKRKLRRHIPIVVLQPEPTHEMEHKN
jgi:deazaflavin-dependent oxidoreductase (nitroreductase family)